MKLTKRYLNSDYRKLKNFFSCHKHLLLDLLHFVRSNYFDQIFKYSQKRQLFNRLKIKINYLAQTTLVILLGKKL